jgi:hypothetical protein
LPTGARCGWRGAADTSRIRCAPLRHVQCPPPCDRPHSQDVSPNPHHARGSAGTSVLCGGGSALRRPSGAGGLPGARPNAWPSCRSSAGNRLAYRRAPVGPTGPGPRRPTGRRRRGESRAAFRGRSACSRASRGRGIAGYALVYSTVGAVAVACDGLQGPDLAIIVASRDRTTMQPCECRGLG